MNYTILTMSRGDEHRIEEWVRYHVGLGFNDFYFILDAPIDNTESMLRSMDVDATITIDVRKPEGDYYDDMTPAERWESVKKWRIEHAEEIVAMDLPVNDALAMRQYKYFPEVLKGYSTKDAGWLGLIDVDEFIVFPGGESIQEITADSASPRIRLLNFNFDMRDHVAGTPVLGQVMRWDRADIVAYEKGWQNRVKTIAKYDSLLPMASVHPISKGQFVVLDPEVGRLHHYKPSDQGIAELPYSVKDETAAQR